jgi:hypothetical protein
MAVYPGSWKYLSASSSEWYASLISFGLIAPSCECMGMNGGAAIEVERNVAVAISTVHIDDRMIEVEIRNKARLHRTPPKRI